MSGVRNKFHWVRLNIGDGTEQKGNFWVLSETRSERETRKDGEVTVTTKGYTGTYHPVRGRRSFIYFRRKSL